MSIINSYRIKLLSIIRMKISHLTQNIAYRNQHFFIQTRWKKCLHTYIHTYIQNTVSAKSENDDVRDSIISKQIPKKWNAQKKNIQSYEGDLESSLIFFLSHFFSTSRNWKKFVHICFCI